MLVGTLSRSIAALCLAGTFLTACYTGKSRTNVGEMAAAQSVTTEDNSLTMNLKAGEILQFAMVKPREGDAAKSVRDAYFQSAIPLAETLGDRYLGSLNIKSTMIGENKPSAIALYAFPNQAAQTAFQSHADWPKFQKMRRQGWEELHVFSVTLGEDTQLKFNSEKNYTIAAAWTREDTLPDYNRYLDGIESDFEKIGARYFAQFDDVTLQSHSDNASDPSQLTLVEWSAQPDLKGLQGTDAYKSNAKYFQKAISRFDLYWVQNPKKR